MLGSLVPAVDAGEDNTIRLALIGRRLGLRIHIVIEKINELELVLSLSRQMQVEPLLGVRVRLAASASGKWQNSGGEKSKFGLSAAQVLEAVAREGGAHAARQPLGHGLELLVELRMGVEGEQLLETGSHRQRVHRDQPGRGQRRHELVRGLGGPPGRGRDHHARPRPHRRRPRGRLGRRHRPLKPLRCQRARRQGVRREARPGIPRAMTGPADRLAIAAFCERRTPADALVGASLRTLPDGATVATGSVRRGGTS